MTPEPQITLDRTESKKSRKKNSGSESTSSLSINSPVKALKLAGVDIHLLGTAHVSAVSVNDVQIAFEELNPDVVCIELCKSRYDSMMDPDRWQKLDIGRVIRDKKLGLLASSLILSAFQKKIGETTGVKPGEEMLRAANITNEHQRELVLADREVRTTLGRAWGKVGFWSKMWLVSNLVASLLVREDLEEEEIERMKQEDVLTDLFSSLPPRYNAVKDVIIDERDRYLAEKIRQSAGDLAQSKKRGKKTILAVLGAGHLPGVERYLRSDEPIDLHELNIQPPGRPLKTILYWSSFSVALGVLGWYLGKSGAEAARDSLIAWVAGRSIGSALGALIARAHPLTILITAVMAPISVFIPGSRLWMFSSLTEVWLKKPRVDDFENIASDTSDFKNLLRALYQNRILKLFWIIFLVSLGLTVGNVIFWIVAIGSVKLSG